MALKDAQKFEIFRELEKTDPAFVEKWVPFLQGLYRHYFRCEVRGWENVPNQTVMFVGNHNGVLTFEVLMLFYAWWQRFGTSRHALGLAHNIALKCPFFRWVLPKLGAIPADPDLGLEALRRDYSLLVFPGGEKEAFRPFIERKKIDFFQRKGFIRLALKARVPIVPVVSIGAHESYLILHRGEELAEALGLKKQFRLHGLPVTFRSIFFLWCLVTGVFTFFPLLLAPSAFASIFIPLPAKMSFELLEPVHPLELWDEGEKKGLSEEENLQAIYDHIVGKMQSVLQKKYAERRFLVFG